MFLKVNQNKDTSSKLKDFMYISLSPEIYAEMFAYVDAFDKECSGTGLVKQYINKFDNGHVEIEFKISKIYLPEKQDNSLSSTEFSGEEANRITTELVMNGISPEEHRLHWHSHNTMDTFHSSTDEALYENANTGDFLVSIVANKAKKLLGRVDFYKPFRVTYNDLPVFIKLQNEISQSVQENIKKVNEYEALNKTQEIGYHGNADFFRRDNDYDLNKSKKKGKGKNKHKENYAPMKLNLHNELIQEFYALMLSYQEIGEVELISNNDGIVGFKDMANHQEYKISITPMSKYEINNSYIQDNSFNKDEYEGGFNYVD